tara:strand:- start:77 stop:529 length:453 start_codon:yes stop_codon:yes gene_type:complete
METDSPMEVIAGCSTYDTHDSYRKNKCSNQTQFLANYGKLGTVSASSSKLGIWPSNHYLWLDSDDCDYVARFESAKLAYSEYLESIMLDRLENPIGNKGSDILLMFALKARDSKYTDKIQVDDRTRDALETWTSTARSLRQIKELDQPKD